ncbi:MAG: LysR substrate-binding domain-containing protein [Pseudomonadota bacterium]
MRPMPPLPSLQALEAVDRLGSVQRAAEALSITPPAISHRLRALEAHLGAPLVAPQGRGLALTARGRALVGDLRPALAALDAALAPPAAKVSGPLRVAAAPGFASAWLCPRLGAFREAAAEVAITLAVGADRAADVEILFLDAPPDDAAYLAQPDFFPVCAPSLAHAMGGVRRPSALLRAPLLHLFDRRDWLAWARATGAPLEADGADGAVFEDANLLLSAAVSGQGVALGDEITCARYLADGALLRPFSATSKSDRAYYLRLNRETGAALAFADWLRSELGA